MSRPKLDDPACARIQSTRGLSARVAEACEIHRAAVYQWERVPVMRVHTVAPLIGMTPEQIRPDVFLPQRRRS